MLVPSADEVATKFVGFATVAVAVTLIVIFALRCKVPIVNLKFRS